jgi:LacI family transcriptional regulator
VDVVVSSVQDTAGSRAWSSRLASSGRSGAIIVTSRLTRTDQRNLARARVPYVLIDPAAELPSPEVATVGATNWAGGLSATHHLLGLGHRRIAVIGGPVAMLCSRARISGYSAALASAGVEVHPVLIRHASFHHAGGYEAARELFELPEPPTAIFAGSDEQAFGVAEAARVTGRRIPEDLSVVGFDDLPISRWFSPPLTTVRQPLAEMGRTAAAMLSAMIDGREPHGRQVELATELVVRSSTASPRGRAAARSAQPGETRV